MLATAFLLLFTTMVAAAQTLHCPLRNAPYSIDTPIVDLLAKPEAVSAIEKVKPDLLRTLTPRMREPRAPTFGAIITPRTFSQLKREDVAKLQPLDRALKHLTITAADKVRRCARYDADTPILSLPPGRPQLLLFEKMTGFRDGPSVQAAAEAIERIAARNGWALFRSDKGGVMTPGFLRHFDAVIWNNVSGDVLTLEQRRAFRSYIEHGGASSEFMARVATRHISGAGTSTN